ncbi:hypothetical protein JW978_03870 [Candidatus Dojkabacteria bacterium]|nr:hypothetical protein [Candidatus Dojkabacteria bacterium]
MNYYVDKIKESIEFAWKYKFLWVFGFILTVFGGGGGSGGSPNYSFPSGSEDTAKMDEFASDVEDFVLSPLFWVILIAGLCVVFVVSLIGWYLLSVSKGALTEAVKKDRNSQDLSLKSSWRDGQSHALDIMMLDLTGFAINFLVFLPLIVLVIGGIIFPPVFILLCCLVPFYIIYFIGWAITYTIAHRYLVLNNAGAMESIKAGFKLMKERVLNIILAAVVSIVPGCAWAIIALMAVGVPAIILTILGIGMLLVNSVIGVVFLVAALIGILILAGTVNSPYQVYSYAYWTKIIMDLLDDKAPK